MKHVYQTMMAACVLTSVGSINAAADYWSVSVGENPVTADNIEPANNMYSKAQLLPKLEVQPICSVINSSPAQLASTTRVFSPSRRQTKK